MVTDPAAAAPAAEAAPASNNQELIDHLGGDNIGRLFCPSQQRQASPKQVVANKVVRRPGSDITDMIESPFADVFLPHRQVLLYFSASWCGPCKRFTPMLLDFYRALKSRSDVEDFEIVYCSMDYTEIEYNATIKRMPWWCMPHDNAAVVAKLAHLYGAEGIPHLTVIDKDSNIIQLDGVGKVAVDTQGDCFPWRPRSLVEMLPKQYLLSAPSSPSSSSSQDPNNNSCCCSGDGDDGGGDVAAAITRQGRRQNTSNLDSKYLFIYASAHWCPPSRALTPLLSNAYRALKKQRTDFELLFLSSDHDQQSFDEYFADMPFGAIPFEHRAAKAEIAEKLQIFSIPQLLVFGPRPTDGTSDRPLINANVRGILEQHQSNVDLFVHDFPFYPKPYGDLEQTTDNINSYKCVIVFCEAADDAEQQHVREALILASKSYAAGAEALVRFYWCCTPKRLSKVVRDALRLGPTPQHAPIMVLLNVPDGGSFYVCHGVQDCDDVTATTVLDFVRSPGQRLLI